MPGVVGGFRPDEILRALRMLVRQVAAGEARIENAYESVVRPDGNPAARAAVERVYEPAETAWRGLGVIPASGLRMRAEYAAYDFAAVRPLGAIDVPDGRRGCRCGEVLRGKIVPKDCSLFGRGCVPEHAVGPCMVSVEGTCAAWYKYGAGRFRYGA